MQALDRSEPPAFPLNAALLPACRQRVKLAVRLDAILREEKKAHAGLSHALFPPSQRVLQLLTLHSDSIYHNCNLASIKDLAIDGYQSRCQEL